MACADCLHAQPELVAIAALADTITKLASDNRALKLHIAAQDKVILALHSARVAPVDATC